MRKISMLLVLVMLAVMPFAFAEEAVPSKNVAVMVTPSASVPVAENFAVYVTPVAEESVEKVVLDNIAEVVKTAPVATYFKEETVTEVAAYLPAETNVETLVMDEFFPLEEEGYNAEYGDVEAVFEFATEYEDETVLVAMVGLLPVGVDAAEVKDEDIVWIPQAAVVVEGKVKITFTQDVLELLAQQDAVMALLRAE